MDELAPVAHGGLMHARPRIAAMRGVIRILSALSILAVACDGRPSVPNAGKGLKPKVILDPLPGVVTAFFVDVTVSTNSPGAQLSFGLNEPPDTRLPKRSPLSLHLTRSTRVSVDVRDVHGVHWGPYTFDYTLKPPVDQPRCAVAIDDNILFFRNVDTVGLTIAYTFANSLSILNLLVDGKPIRVTDAQSAPANGKIWIASGPFEHEGEHRLTCEITGEAGYTGPEIVIVVDGTPPQASWLSAGGNFDQESWPFTFSLQASDDRSGVAKVEVCDAALAHCLAMRNVSGNVFSYATALTMPTSLTASLKARIVDRAGNQALIGNLEIDATDFGEAPPLPPVPITLTTARTVDLPTLLAAHGRTAALADVMSSNLTTAYTAAEIPLAPGWNDFLYRPFGQTAWESFSIYRAGLSVTYPASAFPWLVFSSESTTPGAQGALREILPAGPGGEWHAPWFDVPHAWFVGDVNANSRWDDGDELWVMPDDSFSGRYLASFVPVLAALTRFNGEAGSLLDTKTVNCVTCDGPGALYFERRSEPYAFPASHAAFPAVVFSGGNTEAVVDVWSGAGECAFFWDENADGALNGGEARFFGPCGGSFFTLARQGEQTGILDGQSLHVTGLPYGGEITGELQVRDGSTVLLRENGLTFHDHDGRGRATAPYARERNFPYSVVLGSGSQPTVIEAPTTSGNGTLFQLSAQDELGTPLAAVVAIRGTGGTNGHVFRPEAGPVSVDEPPSTEQRSVFALRDGYLSELQPITGEAMVLPLLGGAVTGRVLGIVTDTFHAPVGGAKVSWRSDWYEATVHTDSSGWFSLPASGGTGLFIVTAGGRFHRDAAHWLDVTRETVVQSIVLPDDPGPAWPLGAHLGSVLPIALTGAFTTDAYVNDRYYAARVTAGTFSVRNANGSSRVASLPGVLPALNFPGEIPLLPPQTLPLAFLEQRVTCGARTQPSLSFSGASIDSTCWSWFARDEYQDYFMGRVDPVLGFPVHHSFGMLNLAVIGSALSLDLHDVLLGRQLHVPVRNGMVRAAVPNGLYAVFKSGGATATDANGEPAVVEVQPIDGSLSVISVP